MTTIKTEEPKPKPSPWSKENLAAARNKGMEERASDFAAMTITAIKKPLEENSLAKAVIVLGGAAALAGLGLLFFAGESENKVTPVAEVQKIEDPGGNNDGWDAAAKQSTANGLPVDPIADKLPPTVPAAARSPKKAVVKTAATPKKTTVAKVAKVAPPATTKIVYRTMPQPIAAKAPPKIKPPVQSFIAFGGGGRSPTSQRSVETRSAPTAAPVAPAAAAPTVVVQPKNPLASEQLLIEGGAYLPPDQLISGTTVSGRLSSAMQSAQSGTVASTMIRVVLDKPLLTNKGFAIPKGATIAFEANINPQNGAVTAESIDGEYLGKKILIPRGSISLQAANNQPLVAQEFKPRMGDLATADRNNAFFGAAGEIGNELTKSQASVNVGNGSTIIQQTNNNPNILGAILKGGAQTYANDQRQRVQQEATKIMAGQPVQFLPSGTPVSLTVLNPVEVKIPR